MRIASFPVSGGEFMPQVTRLIFQDDIVRVEMDNGEALSLPYEAYMQYKLSSAMQIEGELYAELSDESQKVDCRNKAFGYLAARARSVNELERYLKKKGFGEKHIIDTVSYLKGKAYLDDYGFALGLVRTKVKSGRDGVDVIKQELIRKGIARKIIERVIREGGADSTDIESLYLLALKKYNTVKDKNNSLARVGNYLRQRGFDYESIKKVLYRLGGDDSLD